METCKLVVGGECILRFSKHTHKKAKKCITTVDVACRNTKSKGWWKCIKGTYKAMIM